MRRSTDGMVSCANISSLTAVGGFSVYWLAGHHDGRFAALIAHAGIFNTEAQYLETEEMWFANWDMGGAYWEKDNATAQATFANSPHRFVDKWDTPILITHGELDYRILSSQGEMLPKYSLMIPETKFTRKQNSINHQYSATDARPEKVAYLFFTTWGTGSFLRSAQCFSVRKRQ